MHRIFKIAFSYSSIVRSARNSYFILFECSSNSEFIASRLGLLSARFVCLIYYNYAITDIFTIKSELNQLFLSIIELISHFSLRFDFFIFLFIYFLCFFFKICCLQALFMLTRVFFFLFVSDFLLYFFIIFKQVLNVIFLIGVVGQVACS